MPQLAKEIVDNNADGAINFKGFLVGNPFTNMFTNNNAQYVASDRDNGNEERSDE